MASELSAFLSTSCSLRTLVPGGPQPSQGCEDLLLKTATAATKGSLLCYLPLLEWWQGVWGRPDEPIARPRKAERQQGVLGLLLIDCEEGCCRGSAAFMGFWGAWGDSLWGCENV